MTHASNPRERMLARLAALEAGMGGVGPRRDDPVVADLIAGDLAVSAPDGRIVLTAAGRGALRRAALARQNGIDPFRGQHGAVETRSVETPAGRIHVTVDDAESPLAWLARRKGKDGRPMIEPHQLLAGERLRAEFTRAQMMPRITANWNIEVGSGRHGGGEVADRVIAARQRLRRALLALEPDFADLLLDVCCFLKGLAEAERERQWPPRSAKLMLRCALDQLARHYGLSAQARGPARTAIRTWLAPDAAFAVDGE